MKQQKKETVVVTGATGFIGSHLLRTLLDLDYNVVAIVRENSKSCYRLPKNVNNLEIIFGDLANIDDLIYKFQHIKADVFYHLAWSGVGNAVRNDTGQLRDIDITVNMMNLAKAIDCVRWIGTGSQAEYGVLNRPIREEDIYFPTTLYGTTKLSACMLSQLLGKQLGMSPIWARIFSIYGPSDNRGWMLTELICSLLQGKVPKLTEGDQLWDYLYVDDAVDALIALASNTVPQGIYNIGSGKSQPIRSIVELVRDKIDTSLKLTFGDVPYRNDQIMHLEADISKIMQYTGWSPKVSMQEGIDSTISYIKNNMEEYKLR